MTSIELPGGSVELRPGNNTYTIRLNPDDDNYAKSNLKLVSEDWLRRQDILCIKLASKPDNLIKLHLSIGGQYLYTVECSEISDDGVVPLPEGGIYLSLVRFMYVEIVLEYDDEFLESQQTGEMLKQVVYEEKPSGPTRTFIDEFGDYHYGRVIDIIPTEIEVPKITNVICELPTIFIQYCPPTLKSIVFSNIFQKRSITKSDFAKVTQWSEKRSIMLANRNNDSDCLKIMKEAFDNGQTTIDIYISNLIIYREGIASLMYC